MSNEHPDMSGNPCDAPYVCEKCGCQFTDDAKLSGSFFDTETTTQLPKRLTADNARLRESNARHANAAANLATQLEPLKQENARLRELLRECLPHLPKMQLDFGEYGGLCGNVETYKKVVKELGQ